MTNEKPADHDVSGLSLAEQVSLLSGADFWRTRALPERGIPQAMLSDGPHGIRAQQNGGGDHLGLVSSTPSTCFPTAVTTAASWNPALLEEVGAAVERIVNCGGISAKNEMVMQIYADVMGRPVYISRSAAPPSAVRRARSVSTSCSAPASTSSATRCAGATSSTRARIPCWRAPSRRRRCAASRARASVRASSTSPSTTKSTAAS